MKLTIIVAAAAIVVTSLANAARLVEHVELQTHDKPGPGAPLRSPPSKR